MKEIIIDSYGKINLSLDILYKRNDGYHEIESVMQEIDLKDTLSFREREKGIIIESTSKKIPTDSDNLVYKVWEKMKDFTGIERGLHIKIEKTIPVAAGLAGGSSNAAATFKAINKLWDLNFSDQKLMDISKSIGADIPFCLMGGTALAKGIGEKLTSLSPFKDIDILICNPGIEIPSAHAYKILDLNDRRIDTYSLIEAIEKIDIDGVSKAIENKMEKNILKEYPLIGEIKEYMVKAGARASLMSGSGSTVFGIFTDKIKFSSAYKELLKKFPLTYKSKTI